MIIVGIKTNGKFLSPHGYICSSVLYDGKVIINGGSNGEAFAAALSQTDGKILWKIRHNNPVHSFSTVYNEAIAKNSIGEKMNVSPAISNGKIYLRGDKHIYCIGSKELITKNT